MLLNRQHGYFRQRLHLRHRIILLDATRRDFTGHLRETFAALLFFYLSLRLLERRALLWLFDLDGFKEALRLLRGFLKSFLCLLMFFGDWGHGCPRPSH